MRSLSTVGLLIVVISVATILARGLEAKASSTTTNHWLPLTTITGAVINVQGPVAGATVRIQLTDNVTTTAADGSFTLTAFALQSLAANRPFTVTAWSAGHYIGWVSTIADGKPITITLNQHYTSDNAEYNWFSHEGLDGSAACGTCHTAYAEWKQDAHAQSATNPRFLSMYSGTDVAGNKSPLTQYNTKTGVGMPPDLSQPYFGPGFRLDNPSRPGVCAACHTPAAAKTPTTSGCGWQGCHTSYTAQVSELIPDGASPVGLRGDAAEGISCEFCHKIAQVQINDDTGTPYDDSPGILSLKLLRPQEGHDIFFGPFDDVVRADLPEPRDAYLPLQSESEFCASCHYGVMGGVVANMKVTGGVLIYSSFSEWLESYNKGQTDKTCQDCHMPTGLNNYFAFPEKGGMIRDPKRIHSHKMLGKTDEAFMQNAVSMTATAQIKGGKLLVDVSVVNDKTGHAVPTDSVMHHVILVVTAKDKSGKTLARIDGETLPDWAGDYADQPGKVFAKVLRDTWTGETPSAAIWRPVEMIADTRLVPFVADKSKFIFQPAQSGSIIEVKLLYRRAPQQLMQWKGWDDTDMLMETQTLSIK